MTSPYPGNGASGQPPQGDQPWSSPPQNQQPGGAPASGPSYDTGQPVGGPPAPGYAGGPPQYPGSPAGAPGGPGGFGTPPPKKKRWPWIVGGCGCLLLAAILIAVIAIFAVASSGGKDDPTAGPTQSTTTEPTDDPTTTTEEPTTEEPTTEEPTTEEPTDETEYGVGDYEGYEVAPVQVPTKEDLEPAKQATLDFLTAISDGDADKVCATMMSPIEGTGMDSDSLFHDDCLKSWKKSLKKNEENEGKAKGLKTSDFDAKLHADEHYVAVTNKHSDGKTVVPVAKGEDGKMYVVNG